ncbi:MAG: hypothetical protein Q8Q81_11340, partial [Oxalobacteraceae bacterium]|nr:hypothetical protein [Oxalobacteraceae bacterium]
LHTSVATFFFSKQARFGHHHHRVARSLVLDSEFYLPSQTMGRFLEVALRLRALHVQCRASASNIKGAISDIQYCRFTALPVFQIPRKNHVSFKVET